MISFFEKSFLKIFLLILSTIFALISLNNFLVIGPFSWHIKQPEVIEGGIELFILFMFIYGLIKYLYKLHFFSYFFLFLIIILYFRRHNIDFSFFVDLIFVNSLYFIGSILVSKLNIRYKISLIFLVGIALWNMYSLSISFMHLAQINILIYSIIVLTVISFFYKNHNIFYLTYSNIQKNYNNIHIKNSFLISTLIIVFLILCVQSSQNPSYDELWYSLRGIEVLNKNGTFFEPILMLQHWVNFYPKLYEITIFPLEYFDTYTTSRMFTIFILIFFVIAIYDFLKTKISLENILLVIICIITIPAIANSSIIAKADLISAFIVFMSIIYFLEFTRTKEFTYFILSSFLLLFSLTTKFSVIPYIGILALFYIICFIIYFKKIKYSIEKPYFMIFFILFFTSLLVTYRTFNIVGVPFVTLSEIIPFIQKIYYFFNFEYNELFKEISVPVVDFHYNFYELFIKYNFFPVETNLIYAWISNLYTVMIGIYIVHHIKNKQKINIEKIIFILILAIFTFILYFVMGNNIFRGGDGNYHVLPIIIMIVLISYDDRIVVYYKFLTPIIIANILVLFITNNGWSIGTNKFDLDFFKNPFTKEINKANIIKYIGAEDIYIQLEKVNKNKKVIGYGPEEQLFLLNATYESGSHILSQRPYLFSDFKIFTNMLKKTKTTHLLYPKYIPTNKFVEFAEILRSCPGVSQYIGSKYILLDINHFSNNCEYKDNSVKSNIVYIFDEPNTILNEIYSTNLWMNSFELIRDKYYPADSIGIRNGTTLLYNVNLKKHEHRDMFLSLKVMIKTTLYNQKDSGILEIIAKDSFENTVKEQFKINGTNILNVQINLSDLKGDEFNFKFKHLGWEQDIQLILVESMLIDKVF